MNCKLKRPKLNSSHKYKTTSHRDKETKKQGNTLSDPRFFEIQNDKPLNGGQ